MRTLGVSYGEPYSAVAVLNDSKVTDAYMECQFNNYTDTSTFPEKAIKYLKKDYRTYGYAAFTNPKLFSDFKKRIGTLVDAYPVLVDEREALAMSSIITKQWDNCAVIVSDYKHTSLGYYVAGKFYWIKEFKYPNSLALFFSSSMAMLGNKPVYGEQNAIWNSINFGDINDTLEQLMLNDIIRLTEDGYSLLGDYENFLGPYKNDHNLGATINSVYTKAISHLATWLQTKIDSPNLAFAGIGANNFTVTHSLNKVYENVAVHTAPSGAAKALGAAALVDYPLYENAYLGKDAKSGLSIERIAELLLKGKTVSTNIGREAFSINSLGVRSKIAVPFLPILDSPDFVQHSAFCQERDFNTYFSGRQSKEDTGFVNVTAESNYKRASARTFVVSPSSNPILHRILEITRSQGYPVLMCANRKLIV